MAFLYVSRARHGNEELTYLFWPVLLLAVLVSNPISGPRFWVGTVFLAILLGAGRKGGTIFRIRAVILIFVVGFVVLFPLASAFRYADKQVSPSLDGLTSQLVGEDFDSYQQMATGRIFVQDQGFQDGEQIATSIAFFVPRTLWPTKSYGTGEEIGKWAGYKYTNLSAPIWLEGYVDFGYIGTAAFLAILGVLSAHLDVSYRGSLSAGPIKIWAVLVPVFSFYQLLLLRGSLLVVMPRLAIMILGGLFLVRHSRMARFPMVTQEGVRR